MNNVSNLRSLSERRQHRAMRRQKPKRDVSARTACSPQTFT